MRQLSISVVVLSFLLVPDQTQAIVTQKVQVSHSDVNGNVIDIDTDMVEGPPINNAILAQISSPNAYNALGSVGIFGNLGVQASQSVAGEVRTFAEIFSDENFNNTGQPQRATANFIVDGGEVFMNAGIGSALRLLVTVDSRVTLDGNFVSLRTWQGGYTVEPSAPFGPISLTQLNTSLDAFIDPNNPFRVEIPFSLQSFDLGVIPSGGVINLEYTLCIFTEMPNAPEVVFWQFSDPLNVDGFGDFPTVEFTAVPEPSGSLLLCLLLAPLRAFAGMTGRQSKASQTMALCRRPSESSE